VRYRAAIRKFSALLCVLTLLLAQSFGVTAGFLCRCGGLDRLTQIDHCHGPHSEDCHNSQEIDNPQSHLHEDSGGGDREDHEPVRSDVELVPSSEIAVPGLIAVLLAVVPKLNFFGFLTEDTQLTIPSRNVRFSPPLGVIVSRTVVLLM
jgi:hypothetical protein